MYQDIINQQIDDITQTRKLVSEVLSVSERPSNIIALAIDGINFNLSKKHLKNAKKKIMLRSIYPTTTSSVWLSILTGERPSVHGVPGVVFKINKNDSKLINIFNYHGDIGYNIKSNLFSDMSSIGYKPLVISGDLECLESSWKNNLLAFSSEITGFSVYKNYPIENKNITPEIASRKIKNATMKILHSNSGPCFMWYFIDLDQYIHINGYDSHVISFLNEIDKFASELSSDGNCVFIHSDHGLISTSNSSRVEEILNQATEKYNMSMGGAGRTRWFYSKKNFDAYLFLRSKLPKDIIVSYDFKSQKNENNLMRDRIGDIVIIATGTEFITSHGYNYEHGSLTSEELFVPLFFW